jgi:hypothetical protein
MSEKDKTSKILPRDKDVTRRQPMAHARAKFASSDNKSKKKQR